MRPQVSYELGLIKIHYVASTKAASVSTSDGKQGLDRPRRRPTVTAPTPDLMVSFCDANEPRALAARLIDSAHRHPRGWTGTVPDGDRFECPTFDAVAQTVDLRTGVPDLLNVWAGGGR